MSASAKCTAPVHRPSLQVPRLGKPKHQVSELVVPGSAISVKPQFSVKYPSHHPGTPKPPPVFSKRASLRPPASQLGAPAPVPLAKPRPKSIPRLSAGSPAQSHSQPIFPPPAPRLAPAQPGKALKLPQARIPRASSLQAASEARREQMQAQLLVLVNLVGERCQLFAILSASGRAAHHLKQLLAPFAASTLYRYIANCTAFADFVQAAHAPMQQLPVSLVVDFLYSTQLILGAALLCIHSSIRFGDAQRVHWHTLQLSTQGLHAVAYATKTTKAGQPFACTWHGYTGRSAGTSWLLQWLACISSLPAFQQDSSSQPDFLFPHADMQCHALPYIAPASYARTLLCIRWASQSSDICGPA